MKVKVWHRNISVPLLICIFILMLFSGCGFGGNHTYVVIEPHDEQLSANNDEDTMIASSYLSLKNAILSFITAGVEEGNIRVEAYTADVPEDLSQIVYEVSRQNPVGTYMVDYITYDYSKIVNYYDVSFHLTFQHSTEELSKLIYLSDSTQIQDYMEKALENYQDFLLLNISSYTDITVKEMIMELLDSNPEINLCTPEVTVNVYPDTGSQRILEITISYPVDLETMQLAKDTLADKLNEYISLYQNTEDKESICRGVFNRLCRNASVVSESQAESPFYDSMYGAIVSKQGSEKSYAVAYQQILLRTGIYCTLVNATYRHSNKILCRVEINNSVFYVDPAQAIKSNDMTDFEIDTLELTDRGYTILS